MTLSPDLLPRLPWRRPWESRARHEARVYQVLEAARYRRMLSISLSGRADSADSSEDRGGRVGKVLSAARPRLVRRAS